MEKNNYGFLAPVIEDDNYMYLGATKLPRIVYQEDGNWTEYLPENENQKKYGVETQACTIYGTLNAGVEILIKRKYNLDVNYSDRFTSIMAETKPNGNSPHKVAETIREHGLIPESLLQFDRTIESWNDYHSPKPMSQAYKDVGAQWKKHWEFLHEWVFKGGAPEEKHLKIAEALQYSPVGVSVDAWNKTGDLYTKPVGGRDNHWCTCYNIDAYGNYDILDHYDGYLKKLAPNYDFGFAKRYHIEKRMIPTPPKPVAPYSAEWFRRWFKSFKLMGE